MGLFGKKNKDWNQGGGYSGQTAGVGNTVVGETGRLAGNRGTVTDSGESFGEKWVEVKWESGPKAGQTERVRQGEVGGTNL